MTAITPSAIEDFLRDLRSFYDDFGRHDLPWRLPAADGGLDPYRVIVSELMLQQTQVARVIPKFDEFIRQFPDVRTLATVELGEVLSVWSGLGYYRRAKYLYQAAQRVVGEYGGVFPQSMEELQTLPGVGANTAGAVMAYAYDQPVVFIETNIRTVLIHQFLADAADISDKTLREMLDTLLHTEMFDEYFTPREYYWAMMDYGSHLKKTVGNVSRASKHYVRQSAFHGSRRQVRGQVLRMLTERSHTRDELVASIADERLDSVLGDLVTEGLVMQQGLKYRI